MAHEYGVEADVYSFTAACVALKHSGIEGRHALREARHLEALMNKSGEPRCQNQAGSCLRVTRLARLLWRYF